MFENMRINFSYYLGGKRNEIVFENSFSNDDFKADVCFTMSKNFKKLKVSIISFSEMEIEKLYLTMNYSFNANEKIFANGYQSWTDSREFFINETLKTISKLAAPIIKRYQLEKYGDYTFKKYSKRPGEFHGYTYSYIRDGEALDFIGSLTERNGYTIIEEYVKENKIIINKECRGHFIYGEYTPFELIWAFGKENEVFDTYFNLMNIKRPRCRPMTGWTSWYNYYQNINEAIIIENLNNFKNFNKNIDIFQIDDGYETAVGDWLSVDEIKFPKGMKYIANTIKMKGFKAGIWLSPFICETNSKLFNEKKHWILKDNNGELLLAGSNWSKFYVLDFYNSEVREYLKKVFSVVINVWGYDMVKLDFLYAVCLLPRKNKTRGQIMTEAMEFLRECACDKLILGCGVPLGPSFGLVDYCRIGCDVSLDWDDKLYMKLLHRERISTLNAIKNAVGRYQLNGRAFLNDPDVFLLRDDNIKLTETQRETLSTVNKIFGNLLFTSDNIGKYDTKKHLMFDKIMYLKNKTINKVECSIDDLIEVLYNEDGKKYLALINISKTNISYYNKYINLIEVFLDRDTQGLIRERNLVIEPYKSRVFVIKGD